MNPSARMDHLPARSVLRILLMLFILVAPHLPRLPLWLSALILGLGIWRGLAALKTWAMPPKLLRNLLTLVVFTGVYVQYGTLNGHHAGVALLAAMLALKLTEMIHRRDYLVVVYLSYFLLITHFLFSQDMHMILLLMIGAIAITSVLIDVNHPQAALPLRQSLRLSARMSLQAIPLMLLFFLLFPRIPGPLWGLPSDAGAGMTGLSNSMEPGQISHLGQSDEVAFRVRFDGPAPPRNQLYWRGPVFEFFNGRAWLPGSVLEFPRRISARFLSDPVAYEIQLEPHGERWLLGLDLPNQPLPPQSEIGPDLVLRQAQPVIDRQLVKLQSVLDYQVELELPLHVRNRNLALPGNSNPRSQALARQLRAEHGSEVAFLNAVLQRFRQQEYTYTLRPPLLRSSHTVDEFLFETRRGFCEHFASSFTFLMRAAGLPARIVTGYQGAEANADYHIVRQSDAHAWSEVWLPERGWLRVDPTGAVAPERIEFGLGAALPIGEPVPGLARMNRDTLFRLRLQWDRVNALWNRWVLAYGPELQDKLLASLGLPGLRALLLSLTLGTVLSLLLVGFLVSKRHRSAASQDPVLRLWRTYLRKLEKGGLDIDDAEGPQDLLQRLQQEKPQWHAGAEGITRLYIHLRYTRDQADPQLLLRLRRAIRRFPRQLPPHT